MTVDNTGSEEHKAFYESLTETKEELLWALIVGRVFIQVKVFLFFFFNSLDQGSMITTKVR